MANHPLDQPADKIIQQRMENLLGELTTSGLSLPQAQGVVEALERICLNCISNHMENKHK